MRYQGQGAPYLAYARVPDSIYIEQFLGPMSPLGRGDSQVTETRRQQGTLPGYLA